jgi:hypothetical protein
VITVSERECEMYYTVTDRYHAAQHNTSQNMAAQHSTAQDITGCDPSSLTSCVTMRWSLANSLLDEDPAGVRVM